MEKLWPIITIAGPILLMIVVIWAIARNRTSKASYDRSERATKNLYAAENRAEQKREQP